LDADCFAHLDVIAHQLGGAVAASLPAVDLGLAPVSRQVGQSGKFVTPEIYFAIGMSGTPQHFAGVGPRARIIALNTDRHAPIFDFAEAGVTADAVTFLPLLAGALAAMEGQSS
jgi:electron transfer flavoprotein alpha subunit